MVRGNVLLIDESKSLLNACKTVLNGQSHPISILDPHLAVTLLEKKEIEVVVVSSQASDPDSLEYLKKLKNKFPSSSFVLAAQQPTPELILSAFRSGIDDVIKTPTDPSTLFASICRFSHVSETDGTMMFNLYHMNTLLLSDIIDEKISNSNCVPREITTDISGSVFDHILSAARDLVRGSFDLVKSIGNRKAIPETAPRASFLTNGIVADSLRLYAKHIHKKRREAVPTRVDVTAGSSALSAGLRVRFFGHFQVVLNNQCIDTWCSHKTKLLFAHMMLNRKRAHCRDVLMHKFWPDTQPSSARNSLNVAIHAIRQKLHSADAAHEYILFKEECYSINPEIAIWTDVEEFMRHWQQAHRGQARINMLETIQELEAARRLYTSDFMEEDLYDEWASMERENLKEMYLAVLDRLSNCYMLSNNASSAVQLCETILEKDDCREDIHRRLMLCYYRMGSRNKALRQFKKCEEILKAELEVEPTKHTLQLYEEIRNDHLSSSFLKHLTNI